MNGLGGRGPSDASLALRSWTDALLALREIEPKLDAAVRRLLETERSLYEATGVSPSYDSFGPALADVIARRRGVPFWDRTPSDEVVYDVEVVG